MIDLLLAPSARQLALGKRRESERDEERKRERELQESSRSSSEPPLRPPRRRRNKQMRQRWEKGQREKERNGRSAGGARKVITGARSEVRGKDISWTSE